MDAFIQILIPSLFLGVVVYFGTSFLLDYSDRKMERDTKKYFEQLNSR